MRAEFRAGMIECLPVLLAVGPFSAIWGAVAAANGLDFMQTTLVSVFVVAGASQIASVELLKSGAPLLVAILAGAAVNLRFLMYSASLAPWWRGAPLGLQAGAAYFMFDQPYGLSIMRYPGRPEETPIQRLGYFLGVGATVLFVWHIMASIGWAIGARVPPEWGVDFVVPLSFIAIFAPALKDRPSWLAMLVSSAAAVALRGLPYQLGLVIAAGAGAAAGLWAESRRKPEARAS